MNDKKRIVEGVNSDSFAKKAFYTGSNKEVSDLILANSTCSLRKGLSEYLIPIPVNAHYKYAIIHLDQSVQLLLKARLAFKDKNLIMMQSNPLYRIKTVEFDECRRRLKKHCSIEILPNDVEAIKDNHEFRNDSEHFAFLGNNKIFDKIIIYLVSFYWQFVMAHFPNLSFRELLSKKQFDLALSFEKSAKKAGFAARERIQDLFNDIAPSEKNISIRGCPICNDSTAVVDNDTSEGRCFKCGVESKSDSKK